MVASFGVAAVVGAVAVDVGVGVGADGVGVGALGVGVGTAGVGVGAVGILVGAATFHRQRKKMKMWQKMSLPVRKNETFFDFFTAFLSCENLTFLPGTQPWATPYLGGHIPGSQTSGPLLG